MTGVDRRPINFRRLTITNLCVKIGRGAHGKYIKKAWAKAKIQEKWEKTSLFRKLAVQKRRAQLTDFDRFKVMLLRKQVTTICNMHYALCNMI